MTLNVPFYSLRPIGSLAALARALGVEAEPLIRVAARADSLYRLARVIPKPDGRERRVYQALEPLYGIQGRIVRNILRRTEFPTYLMGGIADPHSERGCVRSAQTHAGSALLIGEDASDFFPSIRRDQVQRVFQLLYRFPPVVAGALATLCTRSGTLPQGASPSTYLANLILFQTEPQLVDELVRQGFRYRRFIDDINVSSHRRVATTQIHAVVGRVRGLLEAQGFSVNRKKQVIAVRGGLRTVHNLNVDGKRATIPQHERKNIRAAVVSIERRASAGFVDARLLQDFRSTRGRVAWLQGLHSTQGMALKTRLDLLAPLMTGIQ